MAEKQAFAAVSSGLRATRRSLLGMAALAVLSTPSRAQPVGTLDDLFAATRANDIARVRRMLDAGYDVNSTNAQGDSLLILASREGAADVARLLLTRRARVEQRSRAGESALLLASIRGHLPIVRALLDAGADPTGSDWTPLHYAAAGGHEAVCKLLLDRGAAIDARTANGTTPLMMAARQGHFAVVKLLLWEVADPNLKNESGASALSYAERSQNAEMAKLLRQAGARE